MLRVAGRPFVEHQLQLLRAHGAKRIVLSVGYLGDLIEEEIGDGCRFGLEISYVHDGPEPAGTAGAVRRALPVLGDEFFVLYGDTYLRIDYGLLAFEGSALETKGPDDLADLTRDLAAAGGLAGYPATERFYEIGSPEGLAETEQFLGSLDGPR